MLCWQHRAQRWLGAASLGVVLLAARAARAETGSPGDGLDEPSALDQLDALDELDSITETQQPGQDGLRIERFKGFAAEELRVFPWDRGGPGNDQQLLTELQLELGLHLIGNLSAFVRPWLLVDALDTELLRYEPLEAYLAYDARDWDLALGQFVENWGIADAFNPIDVFNRRDYAVDLLDPPRRGELGARVRAFLPGGELIDQPTLSAYLVRWWRRTEFPSADNRFSVGQGAVAFDPERGQEPHGVESLLWALRFDHTLSSAPVAADVQYLVARGPERLPRFAPLLTAAESPLLVPVYHGSWTLGAGFRAVPTASWWSEFTFKAELVYKRPYSFDRGFPTLPGAEANADTPGDYVQYVVGFDRVFNPIFAAHDRVTLTAEYLGEHGARDPASQLRLFDHDVALRLFWQAGDFPRTSVELGAIVDVSDGEWLAEAEIGRQLRVLHDDLRLELGARHIRAADGGLWSLFPNNSSITSRLQFDF